MQLIPIYLYPNKITAYFSSSWTNERFRGVYNRNIKVYRSSDNKIDLQIKNGDQKPVNIVNRSLVFNLFSQDTNKLLLSRDCEIISNNGRAEVILTQRDLNDLEEGFYNYSLILEQRETIDSTIYKVISSQPLYIDEQFGAISNLEIAGDLLGSLEPTDEIKEFNYINPRTQGEPDSLLFISSIIDAKPKASDPQTLHTFQIYFTDFEGSVTIQGSMGEGGAPSTWVDIPNESISPGTNNFSPESSVVYKNVTGKWNWFRIRQTGHKGNSASFVINRDTEQDGTYDVSIREVGTAYDVGEILIISGKRLGGQEGVNDLIITVTEVSESGGILNISFTGTPAVLPNFRTYVLEALVPPKGSIDKILYR